MSKLLGIALMFVAAFFFSLTLLSGLHSGLAWILALRDLLIIGFLVLGVIIAAPIVWGIELLSYFTELVE